MANMEIIKTLRQETGMSLKQINKAIQASGEDLEAARKWLRENTKVKFSEVSDIKEGCVGTYMHHNLQTGSILLLGCNTDFTARNEAFINLANELALHVTSAKPKWVSQDDIPEDILAAEREILAGKARKTGKPEKIIEKIVEGGLRKFYEENVLLDQKFVKDGTPIRKMVDGLAAQTGETVIVKSFHRLQVG